MKCMGLEKEKDEMYGTGESERLNVWDWRK